MPRWRDAMRRQRTGRAKTFRVQIRDVSGPSFGFVWAARGKLQRFDGLDVAKSMQQGRCELLVASAKRDARFGSQSY